MNLGVTVAIVILVLLILTGAANIGYGIAHIRRSDEPFKIRELFQAQGPNGLTGSQLIRLGVMTLLGALIVAWVLFYHMKWGGNFWRR